MADNMVQRDTGRLGKSLVVQRRRDGAMRLDEFMADAVKLACGHAGNHMRCDHVEDGRRQPACCAHRGKAALVMKNYRFCSHGLWKCLSGPDAVTTIGKRHECQAI